MKSRHSNTKKTIEDVKHLTDKKGDTLITMVYKNAKGRLEVLCSMCKNVYTTTYDSLYHGVGCFHCYGKKKKDIGEIKMFVENRGDQLVSKEYKNNKSPLLIRCCVCKQIIKTSWANYRNKKQCKNCANIKLRRDRSFDYSFVRDYIAEKGDLLVSKTYINNSKKITIKCHKCGLKYNISFSHYKQGVRCGNGCIRSRGETLIAKFLDDRNLIYDVQKRFPGCKDKKSLSYDFYLPDINTCIEFDGMQHFVCGSFGTIVDLEKRITHDSIKTVFAVKNNIRLIRISYKQISQITKILERFLFDDSYITVMSDCVLYSSQILQYAANYDMLIFDNYYVVEGSFLS